MGRPNVLGGNIGTAALALPEAELYVLELSMYQCADLDDSPRTAVLTSLYPEHLDWSGGEREYYRDKLNLVAHGPERVVFNAGDPRLTAELAAFGPDLPRLPVGGPDSFHLAAGPDGEPWFFLGGEPLFARAALGLVGRHNASNLCVALGALQAVGVDCLAAASDAGRGAGRHPAARSTGSPRSPTRPGSPSSTTRSPPSRSRPSTRSRRTPTGR